MKWERVYSLREVQVSVLYKWNKIYLRYYSQCIFISNYALAISHFGLCLRSVRREVSRLFIILHQNQNSKKRILDTNIYIMA